MAIVVDTTSMPGTTIIYDDVNGGIAIDYTSQFNSIKDSLISINTGMTITNDDSSTQSSIEVIAEKLAEIVETNNEVRDIIIGTKEVTGGGLPIKDAYASLSYSALIKVFEEEDIDIDELIAKTQDKLSGL